MVADCEQVYQIKQKDVGKKTLRNSEIKTKRVINELGGLIVDGKITSMF